MCVRVLCVRLQNVRGTVGQPVPGTQLRVVSPDSLEDVAPGEYGLVLARGPGVCACVRACVRVCVCACVCVCVCARGELKHAGGCGIKRARPSAGLEVCARLCVQTLSVFAIACECIVLSPNALKGVAWEK